MKKDIRLIIFICSFLILVWKSNSYYSSTLEKNWDIKIPEFSFYEEIYSNSSEVSFLGDGIRYHIYSYENDHYIEGWLRWKEKSGSTRKYSSYEKATTEWLEELEVEEKFYPDFDNCVYYYEKSLNDEIIIFWDNDINNFYIIENFK